MRPQVFANLCHMLWSDLLWRGATLLTLAAARLARHSVDVATEARMEREAWWLVGYTWRNGTLVRR